MADNIDWKEYLHTFKDPSKTATHTSIGGDLGGGAWHIPNKKLDKFYKQYDKFIKSGGKASLTERPLKNEQDDYLPSQICIDFDFRYNDTIKYHVHDQDMTTALCEVFYEEINNLVEIKKIEDTTLIIQEKPNVHYDEKKKLVKDGIHFIFPFILCQPAVQVLLRKNVMEKVKKILDPLPLTNEISDVYDLKVAKFSSGWMMPYSSKPNCEAYRTIAVFQYDKGEMVQIEREFSIAELSIHKSHRLKEARYTDLAEEGIVKEQEKADARLKKMAAKYADLEPPTEKDQKKEFEVVKKLIDILSEQRTHDYESWLRVGMCLYNINKVSNLPLWIKFSKRSFKFEEGACEKKWFGFKDMVAGPTMGSLRFWAEEDNYDKAKEIINSSDMMKDIIETSLDSTHHSIAEVIKKRALQNFVSTVKMWYYFNGNRWEETHDAMKLRQFITQDITALYTHWQGKYNKMASEQDDNLAKKVLEERTVQCAKIVIKLGDATFKDKVIKESRELFYNKDFLEELDSNKSLLGFENGVYDLKAGGFREGQPSDYLSMTVGYDYPKDIIKSDQVVKDTQGFLKQVLPIDNVRSYAIRVICSCLSGENPDENFNVWTGSGGNGKSKLIDLIGLALGDYACELPVAHLTQKRQASGNASPHIMKTKGKRFCFMQEPNEDDEINVGLMKEMTGGDFIQARALYGEPVKFKPQFKIILMCNKLPKIPSDDDGTWRRLKVTEFISRFRDKKKLNPNKPHDYPIDRKLADNFIIWKSVFMWMLINEYKIFDVKGNDPPKEVEDSTNSYKAREDVLSAFIKVNVIKDLDAEPKTVKSIYTKFLTWFEEEDFNKKDKPKGGVSALREKLDKDEDYTAYRVGNTNKYYVRYNVDNLETTQQTSIENTFSNYSDN